MVVVDHLGPLHDGPGETRFQSLLSEIGLKLIPPPSVPPSEGAVSESDSSGAEELPEWKRLQLDIIPGASRMETALWSEEDVSFVKRLFGRFSEAALDEGSEIVGVENLRALCVGTGAAYPHRTGFRPVSDQCHVGCTVLHVTV